MADKQHILKLIQSHKALENFDYSFAVDWAFDLIRQGKETDNILMLASFSEPIDRFEISPYVTNVLKDLGLEELHGNNAVIAKTNFHLTEILNDQAIRKNLRALHQLCTDNNYEPELMNFYLLFYAWDELDEIGVNYCFNGANLDNIEDVIKDEARKWINRYINGIDDIEKEEETKEETEKKSPIISSVSVQVNIGKSSNILMNFWTWLSNKK